MSNTVWKTAVQRLQQSTTDCGSSYMYLQSEGPSWPYQSAMCKMQWRKYDRLGCIYIISRSEPSQKWAT